MSSHRRQSGMTLIELSLATTILSFLLLVITTLFINLVRQDRAAVSVQDATQSVRYVLDDITRETRLADGAALATGTVPGQDQLCLFEPGRTVQYYVYQTGSGQSLTRQLYRTSRGADSRCSVVTGNPGTQVGSSTQNVVSFTAQVTGQTVPLVTVRLGLVGNLSDVSTTGATPQCLPDRVAYCSITTMETSISLRLQGQP